MESHGSRLAVLSAVVVCLAAAVVWTVHAPAVQAATNPTVVTLTFDDGDADQFQAQQSMAAAGLVGTFYIPTGWIGKPGHLTREQLDAMAADGNEIAGHTVTHPKLPELPPEEARAEMCNGRAVLQSWGFGATTFAYPFTASNPAVKQMTVECGFTVARGLGDVVSPRSCGDCAYAESMPPADPQYLKALDQVDASWTLDHLKSAVTNAVDRDGGWVILTFHRVCSPIGTASCPADRSTTPEVFDAFISWLDAIRDDGANNTVVQTIDQTVRQYLGNAYPANRTAPEVASRPHAPFGVNALENPSLEAADPATGFPSCWQPANWGRHTVAWSTTSPGRTGDVAEQVSVSGYRDGAANLLPTMDVHTCAPTVEPGRTYRLSAWYRSTGTTQFVLYYRDTSYNWRDWTSSPPLEPTESPTMWSEATFTTPPAPADAAAMTFGLALIDDGTLTTDDYALVEAEGPATPAGGPAQTDGGLGSLWSSPVVWVVIAIVLVQALFPATRPTARSSATAVTRTGTE